MSLSPFFVFSVTWKRDALSLLNKFQWKHCGHGWLHSWEGTGSPWGPHAALWIFTCWGYRFKLTSLGRHQKCFPSVCPLTKIAATHFCCTHVFLGDSSLLALLGPVPAVQGIKNSVRVTMRSLSWGGLRASQRQSGGVWTPHTQDIHSGMSTFLLLGNLQAVLRGSWRHWELYEPAEPWTSVKASPVWTDWYPS